jgi:hypothetical protein
MRQFVLLLAIVVLLPAAHAGELRTGSEVAAIQVRLFQTYTGTLSEPIHEGTTLWNTVIGEGGLTEPSNSTFVTIQILGKPKTYAKGQAVELKVTTQGAKKAPTRHVAQLGLFDSEGKQYVGFWLPRTGCTSLRLTARVAGSSRSVQQLIPFKCGE